MNFIRNSYQVVFFVRKSNLMLSTLKRSRDIVTNTNQLSNQLPMKKVPLSCLARDRTHKILYTQLHNIVHNMYEYDQNGHFLEYDHYFNKQKKLNHHSFDNLVDYYCKNGNMQYLNIGPYLNHFRITIYDVLACVYHDESYEDVHTHMDIDTSMRDKYMNALYYTYRDFCVKLCSSKYTDNDIMFINKALGIYDKKIMGEINVDPYLSVNNASIYELLIESLKYKLSKH